jgi:hypothetical protein
MEKCDLFGKTLDLRKYIVSKASLLMLSVSLLLTLIPPTASSAPVTQQPASTTDSFGDIADSCGAHTLSQASIEGGDMQYDNLYVAREEDRPRLDTICGIVKKFASAGKPVERFDPTPTSFFHGFYLRFAGDYVVTIFRYKSDIYLESRDQFLKLSDSKAIQDYQSFMVPSEFLSITPEELRFGEQVQLEGHHPSFYSDSIFVFWIPERPSYSSSPSTSSGALPYPADSALLLYEGKQEFGYYDVSFPLPALGKAADGSMKPLGRKGSLMVNGGPGEGGSYSNGTLELSPSTQPFLSVNGVPSESAELIPILSEGRAMLPLRSAAKLAGQSVDWDAGTWSVLIRSDPPEQSESTYLYPQLWIDGKLASPELQPVLIGGLTYVPIRALSAAFGISVGWDNASRSVLIDL